MNDSSCYHLVIRISEKREEYRAVKKLLAEIMTKNLPKLERIQEAE